MNPNDALAVITAALVSVLATAVVARPTWSANAKRATAAGIAVTLGLLSAVIDGQISGVPESVTAWVRVAVVNVAAVIAAAQGLHRQFSGALGSLSAVTSPAAAPAPDGMTDPGLPEDDPLADPGLPEHAAEPPSVIPDGEGVAIN